MMIIYALVPALVVGREQDPYFGIYFQMSTTRWIFLILKSRRHRRHSQMMPSEAVR